MSQSQVKAKAQLKEQQELHYAQQQQALHRMRELECQIAEAQHEEQKRPHKSTFDTLVTANRGLAERNAELLEKVGNLQRMLAQRSDPWKTFGRYCVGVAIGGILQLGLSTWFA